MYWWVRIQKKVNMTPISGKEGNKVIDTLHLKCLINSYLCYCPKNKNNELPWVPMRNYLAGDSPPSLIGSPQKAFRIAGLFPQGILPLWPNHHRGRKTPWQEQISSQSFLAWQRKQSMLLPRPWAPVPPSVRGRRRPGCPAVPVPVLQDGSHNVCKCVPRLTVTLPKLCYLVMGTFRQPRTQLASGKRFLEKENCRDYEIVL